tara:strand:+ start:711 stop:1076 length:366 start_codon:yes stop_codon:yes gene_type:complete
MRLSGFKTYRGLLALLMLLATTFSPLAHAKTNEPVYLVTSEEVATTDHLHDHGHSHDVEAPKDHTSNHAHDHNPADHSHDVPGISAILSETPPYSFSDRQSVSVTSQVDRMSFDIDRPPRF